MNSLNLREDRFRVINLAEKLEIYPRRNLHLHLMHCQFEILIQAKLVSW